MKPVGIKISGNTVKGHAVYILGIDDRCFQRRRCNASFKQSFALEVIHDGRPAGSKSYMWVHLTGELSPDPRIIVYEYQFRK